MIVTEQMISGLRGNDGLCSLSWEPARLYRYSEYAELFEQVRLRHPTILEQDAVTLTDTSSLFEKVWSDPARPHGTVAVLAFTKQVPKLPESRQWWALRHQCGGYACIQTAMIATRLTLRLQVKLLFDRIAAENYGACGGWFDNYERDEEITERYLSEVKSFGLICDEAARGLLRESIYPVNATAEALALACEDTNDLLPLFQDTDTSPVILFLCENSD